MEISRQPTPVVGTPAAAAPLSGDTKAATSSKPAGDRLSLSAGASADATRSVAIGTYPLGSKRLAAKDAAAGIPDDRADGLLADEMGKMKYAPLDYLKGLQKRSSAGGVAGLTQVNAFAKADFLTKVAAYRQESSNLQRDAAAKGDKAGAALEKTRLAALDKLRALGEAYDAAPGLGSPTSWLQLMTFADRVIGPSEVKEFKLLNTVLDEMRSGRDPRLVRYLAKTSAEQKSEDFAEEAVLGFAVGAFEIGAGLSTVKKFFGFGR